MANSKESQEEGNSQEIPTGQGEKSPQKIVTGLSAIFQKSGIKERIGTPGGRSYMVMPGRPIPPNPPAESDTEE